MNYMHGFGEMIYGNTNSIYLGFWYRNKKEGFGVLFRKNNNKALIGFWKGNKMTGVGKLVVQGQKNVYGFWKDNKIDREILNQEEAYTILEQTSCGNYKVFFDMEYDSLLTYCSIIMNK